MVEGSTFEFEEAAGLGIINKIFEADNFFEDVMEYAKQFVPPNKASRAVGRIKRAVCSGVEVPFSEGLAIERELQQLLFQGDDAREGLNAYIEKRKPVFTGN
jgi:enoyl-CoA hydratase/carnithine racemase